MTDVIRVPFTGERSGRHELSWGQRDSRRVMDGAGVSMCIGGVEELPPDTTIESVVATMRFVFSRHEALRSKVRFDPDGHPCLELFDAGEFLVEFADVGDGDPGPVVFEQLRGESRCRDRREDMGRAAPVHRDERRVGEYACHVVRGHAAGEELTPGRVHMLTERPRGGPDEAAQVHPGRELEVLER